MRSLCGVWHKRTWIGGQFDIVIRAVDTIAERVTGVEGGVLIGDVSVCQPHGPLLWFLSHPLWLGVVVAVCVRKQGWLFGCHLLVAFLSDLPTQKYKYEKLLDYCPENAVVESKPAGPGDKSCQGTSHVRGQVMPGESRVYRLTCGERWSHGRAPACQSRRRWFNPICHCFETWAILFAPHLPVSFGRDTKSRWSLLSGVSARGSKRSHTGGKCVTCSGLTNSRRTTLKTN